MRFDRRSPEYDDLYPDGLDPFTRQLETRVSMSGQVDLPDDQDHDHGDDEFDLVDEAHLHHRNGAPRRGRRGDRDDAHKSVDGAHKGVDGHHFSETGNSDRLIAAHGNILRFVPRWGRWLIWDETRWREDHHDVHVTELAKDVARRLWALVPDLQGNEREHHIAWAKRSEWSSTISATIRLSRGVPGVPLEHEELDADPWIFNAANGVIDLKTGRLCNHDPHRLVSKISNVRYDQNARSPRWEKFLATVIPDADVRSYVQRAVGYSLTGDVGEQVMFLMIGDGANGKSTFVETINKLFGEYGTVVAKDLLITQRHEAHPTSTADLFRIRFAAAVETEATGSFNEASIKQLTGGDRLKARRMREDFWTFAPTHKLWLAANHLPKITGTDLAIWRRLPVIPFTVTIPEEDRDPRLPQLLEAELDGILQWAIEGCRQWQQIGLNPPAKVTEATTKYRSEMDWFTAFTDDTNLVIGNGYRILAGDLQRLYREWATGNGDIPYGRVAFAKELRNKGCEDFKFNSARFWKGIGKIDETF